MSIETGSYAKLADGAVTVQFGDTVVFGAVVRANPREGIDFFPLQVDYRERRAAAGKFPVCHCSSARLLTLRSVSGWSGPRVFSRPAKARRYKGSAAVWLPMVRYNSAWLLTHLRVIGWSGPRMKTTLGSVG